MSRTVVGISLKLASAAVFVAMVALVKLLSDTFPTGQLVFSRAFFGIVPVLIWITFQGQLATALKTKHPATHIVRGLVGTSAMALWFTALGYLPLPDATAISYAAPLVTVAFAAVLLQEKVRVYRWSAVAVGFVGVLVVLFPHLGDGLDPAAEGTRIGAIFALISAVFMALATIFIRKMTATETTAAIVVYFSITATVISLLTLPFGWVWPSPGQAALLVLIGLMGGVGQILLTSSYRFAEASVIAPFDYSTMIWTILIGIVFFDEVPTLYVIAGAAIVIGAGLFVIYRESRLGIDRSAQRKVTTPMKV